MQKCNTNMRDFKQKEILPLDIQEQKVLDDYFAFFTTKEGSDVLPYVYYESSNLYDSLVRDCEDYYLFRDEVELIQKNKAAITHYLKDIKNLIEIGPGSVFTVQHKTLSILKLLPNLKNYYPIDHSTNYLKDSCKFIKQNIKELKIYPIEVNLFDEDFVQINKKIDASKAIIMLGSTLQNFNYKKQLSVLKKISNLLEKDEMFIITNDFNHDKSLLLKAYNNEYTSKFLNANLKYFAKINYQFAKFQNSFNNKVAWNESENYVDISFIPQKTIKFPFNDYTDIILHKGQELRGIKSRKPHLEDVLSLLEQSGFMVQDVLNNSGKMKMFVCVKR